MTISGTGRARGFTLIEILVVISLIMVLVAALVANTIKVGQRAYVSSTKTLLNRLDLALGSYRDRVGFYPPDGFDGTEPVNARDVPDFPLRASMCLYETLGRPLVIVKPAPGGRRVVERYPTPLIRFRETELYHHPEYNSIAEILDAWGVPIHYDRLEGPNSYSIEDAPEIHLEPPPEHPPDPREVEASAQVVGQGQNPGKYDIWSHGPYGHEVPPSVYETTGGPTNIICNWRLPKSE